MSGATATLLATEASSPVWAAPIALARAEGAAVPDWMQLLPAGTVLTGRDGRQWTNPDPERLVTAFASHGGPIALDYEHAQDHLAPKGIEAPAAGWVEEVALRDGALWGRVDWTPRARRAIASREYRFFSPAFTYDPASGAVGRLVGGALVNRPNFVMAALNRETSPMLKEIAAALGLAETATATECVMGIAQIKADKQVALNAAATPDLAKFVPRADLETALNRATAAEGKLATLEGAGRDKAVTDAVEAAIAAGKIAPASKDFYLATCRQKGGLASFEKHVASLPTMFKASDLAARDAGAVAGTTALNAEQVAVCRQMNIPEKDFVAFLANKPAA